MTRFRTGVLGWILLGLASCDQGSTTLFQLLPPDRTGIDFRNEVSDQDSFNIIQYVYFYNGGGVAVGDVNNDDLPDVYFSSNQSSNRLYLNQGGLVFKDVTDSAGVGGSGNWTTGVNMVDINQDGWLDIYVCQVGDYKGFSGRNQLFINNGPSGTFTEKASEYGLDHVGFATQSAFFDYDLDGDLDMYLLCHSVHSTETYRDTSSTRIRDDRAGDKLFRNDGNGHFSEVSEAAGILGGIAGYGLGIAIGDIDQNGCPDIYVGNDFHENDFLYFNNCDGTFSERSSISLSHTSNFSMGNDLADVNNDGWLDIVTLDMKPEEEEILKKSHGIDSYDIYRFKRSYGYAHQYPRNMLQVNLGKLPTGAVRFSEVGQIAGISATDWSWSALIADFDNDGWKDLHITNGILHRPNDLDYLKFISSKKIQEEATDLELIAQMPSGEIPNYAYRNLGNGNFEAVTKEWGLALPSLSQGAAYADLDRDGDLDLVVNNMNQSAFVYENRATNTLSNHFLRIKLKGPTTNPSAIGAKIKLVIGSETLYQEVQPVRGWQSAVEHSIHFGLGMANSIDLLQITWPNGSITSEERLSVDQELTYVYQDAVRPEPKLPLEDNTVFSIEKPGSKFPYKHRENLFYDNNREPLIPYLLSTPGPKLAKADVNGDQLEDLFVGGASGQEGMLLLQQEEGGFIPSSMAEFAIDAQSEDTDAVFFDVDMDGDLDLYIGSGGNEFYHQNPLLIDRLYLNDGAGHFTKTVESIPSIYNQTSCVKVMDIEGDGDLDLFVGSRSVPVSYGMAPDSHFLINDGRGTFSVTALSDVLKKLGMVTDGAWTDVDGDEDADLIVVGEWMPVTILRQDKGQFSKEEIPRSSGWWNTIEMADLDGDGDEDWIAGNFGMNSNLQPNPEEPLRLYVQDFDGNLSKDPILTYYRQGKEYPFSTFDEVAKQLVILKKKYFDYRSFADQSVQDVFGDEILERSFQSEVNNFFSSVGFNDGGRFRLEQLPSAAQWAPIQAILIEDLDNDQQLDVLLGGNFYEIQPAIGRQDALYGVLLKGDGKGGFRSVKNETSGLLLEGQVRDLELIRTSRRPLLITARNNDSLLVHQLNLIQ